MSVSGYTPSTMPVAYTGGVTTGAPVTSFAAQSNIGPTYTSGSTYPTYGAQSFTAASPVTIGSPVTYGAPAQAQIQSLGGAQVNSLFNRLDSNHDGSISRQEFQS